MTDFETKYRDLVAGLEALHHRVDKPAVAPLMYKGEEVSPGREAVSDCSCGRFWPCPTAALLASSPAEREGEGVADITFDRMPKSSKVVATIPAPVSSGEAGEP